MRIATWNVNGMRAALRKGFDQHLRRFKPQVLLLQEVRARPDQLPSHRAKPRNWQVIWHPAEKPGYAGTGIWSRLPMEELGRGIGDDDEEGRVIHARVTTESGQGVHVVSVYQPSGSSGDVRQAVKEAWMKDFAKWASRLLQMKDPVVMGGDFNIAHTERDIYYAKGNMKNSGFLPHERAWVDDMLACGWRDVTREHFGECEGPYSWWSNRGKARELNRGWRIDYLLANEAAAAHCSCVRIDRKAGITVSDHAPVMGDFNWT